MWGAISPTGKFVYYVSDETTNRRSFLKFIEVFKDANLDSNGICKYAILVMDGHSK